MLMLTGSTPEVNVYAAREIRDGSWSVGTWVTMTMGPAPTLEEVAGIYNRLQRFHAGNLPHGQAVRRYRLAKHLGPYFRVRSGPPESRTVLGCRPSPRPVGALSLSSSSAAIPGRACAMTGTGGTRTGSSRPSGALPSRRKTRERGLQHFGQVNTLHGWCPWLSARIGGWKPAGTDV